MTMTQMFHIRIDAIVVSTQHDDFDAEPYDYAMAKIREGHGMQYLNPSRVIETGVA